MGDKAFYTDYYKQRAEVLRDIDEDPNRFVPFSSRKVESCWTEDFMKKGFARGKYQINWKGIGRMKDPCDIILYENLIWETKPKSIIELGTAEGGSAMWMADCLKMFNIDGKVYTFDIDMNSAHPTVREREDVEFIEGDSMKIEEYFPQAKMTSLPHPWIVIEDAHINIVKVMEHFHNYMEPGDYFIVDDTSFLVPKYHGEGLTTDYAPAGDWKYKYLKEFMTEYQDHYAVDAKYCDWFGYNGTLNCNGFLKKLK